MCDLRVVEEDAVMGIFNRRWGVPLMDGGSVRLPRLIGLSCALDLILTGRPVDAAEALRMGLANRLVAKGTARQAAEELAQRIAAFPQICLHGDRISAYEQFDLTFEEAMANEFKIGQRAIQEEAIAGATRFAKGAGRHGDFNNLQPETDKNA
jgi:enoyl-CoA hydratase